MLFRGLIAAAVVTLAICLIAGAAAGVIICGAVLLYLGSLLAAPQRRCISCKGAGFHSDPLGTGGIRTCWTCRGKKKYARWGTMLLRPGVHAQIKAGKHGRNY